MAVDFLNIPGDIRQQYMPFTIAGPGVTQLFSYKENGSSRAALIHPFSKHLQTLIANDSSFQYTHGDKDSSKKIEYKDFLDAMPGIQIREFVPDAKLTQTFKWFSYLKQGFDAAMQTIEKEAAGDWQAVKDKLSEAWAALGEKMQGLTSGNAPILAEVASGLTHYYRDRGFNVGPDKGFAVLFIPFLLYYRLTTTHTNNIYEIPYSMKNNIMESDGTYGWGDDNGSDFPLVEAIGKKFTGAASMLMPGLGSTIKVNAMPSFNPSGSARSSEFTVSFDLVNDSDEAAVNNFLMCHTLFGNNRWLQYGFVQTGASLYDVKFPGANRYFMCKGRFVCKGKGGFRTPSQKVIEDIVGHHGPSETSNTIAKAWGSASDKTSVAGILGRAEARNMIESYVDAQDNSSQAQESETQSLGRRDIVKNDLIFQTDATIASNAAFQKANKSSTSTYDYTKGDVKITLKKKPNTIEGIDMKPSIDQYRASRETVNKLNSKISQTSEAMSQDRATLVRNKIANDRYVKANDHLKDVERDPKHTEEQLKEAQEARDSAAKKMWSTMTGVPESEVQPENITDENLTGYYETDTRHLQTSILDNDTTIAALKTQLKDARSFTDESGEELEDFKQLSEKLGENAANQASGHVNASDSVWRDLIKIPDVYSLELTFSSLIPDNFNNYLYGWRADNLDPIENYFKGGVNELGAMEELVQNLIKAVGG